MPTQKRSGRFVEHRMASALDDIREFEEFQAEVLPKIRKLIKEGKTAQEIAEFAQAYAAARIVTIALTDEDSAKALAASRDLIDRAQGKAKERTETTHKFEKLKDEELDALLASRLKEATDGEDKEDLSGRNVQ